MDEQTSPPISDDPSVVLALVSAAREGDTAAPTPRVNVNWWLYYAEASASRMRRARRQDRPDDALAWAKAGHAVYAYLAEEVPDHRLGFETSGEHLRVLCIHHVDERLEDPFLDPSAVFGWVRRRLSISFDEAVERSKTWKAEGVALLKSGRWSTQEFLCLRRIKSMLGVLYLLVEDPNIVVPPDLMQWYALRADLP